MTPFENKWRDGEFHGPKSPTTKRCQFLAAISGPWQRGNVDDLKPCIDAPTVQPAEKVLAHVPLLAILGSVVTIGQALTGVTGPSSLTFVFPQINGGW